MTILKITASTCIGALLAFSTSTVARAATTGFSEADQAFVAKVSQGGMYEVKLGQLAEEKAVSDKVKENGKMEASDHTGVGRSLTGILKKNNFDMPAFNAHFQARLDHMKSLPADKFDAAYLADMKKIHDADGAAFAKEAQEGSNPDLKDFAADTYKIVQRHLGELAKLRKD